MAEHIATKLTERKKLIFTAQSARNFHQRMLICRFVFEQGSVPLNPFMLFGYFLYELVDRNVVRNGNNNVLSHCDELWVFGDISDGVAAEIKMARQKGKPIRYFDIRGLPKNIIETDRKSLPIEA
jgi:hypothetical protein